MMDEPVVEEDVRAGGAALVMGLVGLAVFLAVQALALKSFSSRESRPPAWDQSIHLEIALDYRAAWKEGDLGRIWTLAPKPGMPPFPPLFHVGMMALTDPADPVATSLRVNWVYLALLSLAIFMIAYEFRPDATALAAAMVFVCSPIVQRLYHTQLVDLAVTACVAMAYWALIASQGFRLWRGSLAFGVLFAVGMMHKWSFFTYMAPAYMMGAAALFDRNCRHKAAVAAVIGLAGCLPWYVIHLPILVPRLLEASADYGVPVWKGTAFFQYFLESVNALGVPFFLMGWFAVMIPDCMRAKKRWWVIPAWLILSYLIWAVVPNRQMRFLLPGLVPLGVGLGIAALPKVVVWSMAAVQIVLALNFATGWIAPVTVQLPLARFLPFPPIELTPSDPPRSEDWRLTEILREVEARRDKAMPAANLTLVANDTYFNGPNFNWAVKGSGLAAIRIRGVNRRLSEFSEFILLKKGYLGPEKVTLGLAKAAETIEDKDLWVAYAYEVVKRWPLPDQSEAVLYQLRKLKAPIFKQGRANFDFFTSTGLSAVGMKLDIGRWDAAKGSCDTIGVTAQSVSIRDLAVSGLDAELADVMFVPLMTNMPASQSYWDDVRFLKMRRLKVRSLTVTAEDLKGFLEKRVNGLVIKSMALDKDISVDATVNGIAVQARVSVALLDSPRRLFLKVERAALGVTPVPVWLLGVLSSITVSLENNPETPFFIDLPGLTIRNGRLTIP
ncbi:MAG: glycosyltransferase family 39 protein [Elusimicrobia bacterium]|nr:glycosyltransferase family 39 protein [Elusimicrobiota bacterium]